MPRSMVAAVAQMCSRQDLQENLATAAELCRDAAARGAQLVVLPENFTYIGGLAHKLATAEPLDPPGPVVTRMSALARELGIHLLLGGIPIRGPRRDRFLNTAVLLDDRGAVVASYCKIHLFDINIPGRAVFHESQYVLPGDRPVVARALDTTLGLSICYDLRFPELYRRLVDLGAELIAVPAAFTLHTGKDHWFPLLRARAIETQCFVLAAAQHGQHIEGRTSFGKACIVDPWGAVLAQVPDADGVALARLDLDQLERIRAELPALSHRRL